MRIPKLALLVLLAGTLCACSEFDKAIYVNCDLVSAKGFSETETDEAQQAKIPWVRNVKSFTGKFPIGWTRHDGTFAGTDVQVTETADTKLAGTLKYTSHLIEQPDGKLQYDPDKGKQFDYTFTFNRLNNELMVMSMDSQGKNIKVGVMHFACRRVTP